MVTFTHDGPGTREDRWLASGRLQQLPTLDPRGWGPEHTLVVLAAHPDDESLGAGGLIATAAARGAQVVVVVATAGEGSHPRSRTITTGQLAARRALELRAALQHLGPGVELHELGLDDGGVAEYEDVLERRLAEALPDAGSPAVLVAPWRGDGHADHEACGRVAAAVARRSGVELLEYPVWAWHWASPHHPTWPWEQALRLDLAPDQQQAKARAVRAHATQVEPLSDEPGDEVLLQPSVLAHFERDHEVFFSTTAPRSLGPQYFVELYDRHGTDPWGLTDRWYEQRKRAQLLAALPRPRFRSAFEPGCSIGVLTTELAQRCDSLVAMDPVPAAVAVCRSTVQDSRHVDVRSGAVPQDWPDGRFDLIVLSEVAYYCAGPDLRELVRRCRDSLTDDGVLVACHWRHPAPEHPSTAEQVHDALRHDTGLVSLARHKEEDFLLDVLVTPPGLSVARSTGLL